MGCTHLSAFVGTRCRHPLLAQLSWLITKSHPCCSQVARDDAKNTGAGAARPAAPPLDRCPNQCGCLLNTSRKQKCQVCAGRPQLLSMASVKATAAAMGGLEPDRQTVKRQRRSFTRARVADGTPLTAVAAAAAPTVAPGAAAAAAAAATPAADVGTSRSSANVLELCMCELVDPSTLQGSIQFLTR